jgi:hypothetical protein
MLEFIAGAFALVLGAVALLFFVVLLPFLLIGGILKLVFGLFLLPFRLIGLAVGVVGGLFFVVFKIAFFFLAILAVIGLFAGGAVTLALAPLILLGLGIWLLVRLFRSGSPLPAARA